MRALCHVRRPVLVGSVPAVVSEHKHNSIDCKGKAMRIERQPGPPGASFSGAVLVEGSGAWVFVSGQLGTDDEGNIVEGGLAAETRAAFGHLVEKVVAAGGDTSNVVRLTAYLTSLEEYQLYGEVRRGVFGETLPASTAIQVAGLLGGATVEIDAIAFIPAAE